MKGGVGMDGWVGSPSRKYRKLAAKWRAFSFRALLKEQVALLETLHYPLGPTTPGRKSREFIPIFVLEPGVESQLKFHSSDD